MAAVVTRTQAWILATRPRTLSAAAAPVVAGSGFAAADGVFALLPALAAMVGALLIQIATNLANDYYDFVKGGDTGDRLGPVRVTQAGILPPEAVFRGMVITLALATLTGVYLAWVAGWPVIAVGLASMLMGVCYTGGPYPLSYHGLGDVFVFVFFGPVATAATYYVQAQVWSPGAIMAGAGLGAFSTAMLVVNNLRDRETDGAAGKRTLAVRYRGHVLGGAVLRVSCCCGRSRCDRYHDDGVVPVDAPFPCGRAALHAGGVSHPGGGSGT